MPADANSAGDRLLCGWRLRSALPLPELLPWTGDDRQPDIAIRLGTLAPRPADDFRFRCEDGDIDAQGRLWIDLTGIGRFLVAGPHEVTVAPQTERDSPWLRAQLYGTVLAVLCGRRGILPMHGGCVVIDGRAHLFIGDKGAGKSSLAATLMQRGHRLVTDDLCPIRWEGPDGPVALPGVPRLRLCPDIVGHLGIDSAGTATLDSAAGKYLISASGHAQAKPVALAAIHHMSAGSVADVPRLEPISGLDLVVRLQRQIHRWELAGALGYAETLFRGVATLATAVPHYRLWRGGTLAGVEAMADLMEAWRNPWA